MAAPVLIVRAQQKKGRARRLQHARKLARTESGEHAPYKNRVHLTVRQLSDPQLRNGR